MLDRPRDGLTILAAFPGWIDLTASCEGCEITLDPGHLADADAVIFHIPTTPIPIPLSKRPGQAWVAWSFESDRMYPQLLDEGFMCQFEATVSYRRHDDVVLSYCQQEDWLQFEPPPLVDAREPAVAVYLVSNPHEISGRTEYVRELMRHVRVDSYGRSLNNRTLANDIGRTSRLATYSRYRFTLAFENSIAPDYVTEKFFDPLLVGSVPVYLGAPNVAEHAPAAGSYIDVRDHGGPAELAQHLLHLTADEAAYASYLDWRTKPLDLEFVARVEEQREPALCRLCRLLRRRSRHGDRSPRVS